MSDFIGFVGLALSIAIVVLVPVVGLIAVGYGLRDIIKKDR